MSKKNIHRRKTKKEAKNRFRIISGKSGRGKFYFIDEAHSFFKDASTGSKTVEAMKMVKSLGLSDDVMIVDLDRKK